MALEALRHPKAEVDFFRPSGALLFSNFVPMAYAMGCILAPLRGWGGLDAADYSGFTTWARAPWRLMQPLTGSS